jgi:pyruvate formate lyase activating enzyme
MKIAGLQPVSLCDYPSKVAAVVFTQGCNLHCPFCHNGGLVPAEGHDLIPQEEVLELLRRRSRLLDGVVISGGEPTLQSDLQTFIRRVRDLNLSVKLDTNGTRPEVIEALLAKGLLDFIAMDVKAPFEKYPLLTGVDVPVAGIKASLGLIAASGIGHEFRTTFVHPLLTDADIEVLRRTLPPASPYTIQSFRPELAVDPGLRMAS